MSDNDTLPNLKNITTVNNACLINIMLLMMVFSCINFA